MRVDRGAAVPPLPHPPAAEEVPIDSVERLQRVLASRGIASRRNAEALIRAGRVTVDGRVVSELGTKVDPRAAAIAVDGKPLRPQKPRYVLLNKPTGYITTTNDERGRRTVMDLVPTKERIYPVGRLDRDTEGLLLLTNDGDVAHRVMHPRHELAKEYHVVTLARPSDATARRVRDGVLVEGRRIVPDEFRILRETREGIVLKLVIHEGMYHAVRRMMDAVGIPVETLRRVRLGPLILAGIPPGGWRDLSDGERASLFEALRLRREETTEGDRAVVVERGGPSRPRRRPNASPAPVAGTVREGERRSKGSGADAARPEERPAAESPRPSERATEQPRRRRRGGQGDKRDEPPRGKKGERTGDAAPPRRSRDRPHPSGARRDGRRPKRGASRAAPPAPTRGPNDGLRRRRSVGQRRANEPTKPNDASRRPDTDDRASKKGRPRGGRGDATGGKAQRRPRRGEQPDGEQAARDGHDDR